jgi:uncharacterized membrane-anchored protein YhcB (DUF1043 family)
MDMEIVSVNGLILVISVCVIAFLIGRLTSKGRKDKKRLETELEQSREELSNYRSQVTSHFRETAHRVNALTENYRNVYEHLARGAQDLCDKSDAPELMSELNRNPMLDDRTTENPEVDHEIVSAQTNAGSNPGTDSEPERTDENPDNTANSGQNGDTPESYEAAENNDGNTNADENVISEPIIAADERIKSDQQPLTRSSST